MAKAWAKSFYNSREWQLLRDSVLMRSGHTCAMCGGFATEVHHIRELTPDNILDRSVALNPDNLMPLCSECHKRITKVEKGFIAADCDRDFYFDADGRLSPRGMADFGAGEKTEGPLS